MEEVRIRKYRSADRVALREIAWETAFMGETGERFFSGSGLLADFLTLYFTDHEPQSCYVAEAAGSLAGYLLGAKDTARMDRISALKLTPYLLFKAIASGAIFKKKNLLFLWRIFLSYLGGEFRGPDLYRDHPATLHINIRQRFRSFGIGSRLVEAYLDYLRKEGVSGVRLATFSAAAGPFFRKNGFDIVYQHRRSYFRHILGRDVQVYIYARKL